MFMIVFHNLYHNINQHPSQNEFSFSKHKIYSLFDIAQNNYTDLIRALFSYFGHYGVQLFIFLSAYGLAKKYKNNYVEKNKIFLRAYYNLILPFVYLLFILLLYMLIIQKANLLEIINEYGFPIFLKIIAINIPGYSLSPVGPWWFIPMILQFYMIFPFLINLYKKHKEVILIVISVLAIISTILLKKKILYFNVLGHVPVICLGIYFAYNKVKIPRKVFFLSLFIFIAAQFNQLIWVLGPLAFVLIFIFCYKASVISFSLFSFIGKISLFMFLTNGFLRTPFLWMINQNLKSSICVLAIGFLYFLYVILVSAILHYSFEELKKTLV